MQLPAERFIKATGVDITGNVNFRMTTPKERNIHISGGPPLDHVEQTILSRLPASMRDEAIWQYHLNSRRGFVFWGADHSLRYLSNEDYDCIRRIVQTILEAIPQLLDAYDPAKQALVVSEYADAIELARIEESGEITLLRREPLTLDPLAESDLR